MLQVFELLKDCPSLVHSRCIKALVTRAKFLCAHPDPFPGFVHGHHGSRLMCKPVQGLVLSLVCESLQAASP
jgi:hypothetical protein